MFWLYFLEPLSVMELKLLKQFLPHNLNTASAPFRQTLFVSMKKILGRVRDGRLVYKFQYKQQLIELSEVICRCDCSLILLKEHFQLANQRKMDCALPDTVNTMFGE